ncbi:MAG: mechanosensitive ion channel family protein [Spirochaetaceae bacterium]|jgi:MscS family membrane protein|nr:mechanosensitive ion channel family protein [Spirochaetaceae bacterium]
MERLKALLVENTGPQWAEAILLTAGGIIAGILFSSIIYNLIKKITSRTKNPLDDVIVGHLNPPIALLFVVGGLSLGLGKIHFSEQTEYWKDRVIFTLFVCIISWTVMRVLDAIIVHYAPSAQYDIDGEENQALIKTDFKPVLRRLVNITMFIIPTAIIVKSFGYDISAVLATLGIGGAALALAARDILASFFGSIAVLADKPFHVGDRICFLDGNYGKIDGFVTEIRFRTTRVKTFDNRIVTIPNGIFGSVPVQNASIEPHTRVVQTITIRASNGYEKTRRAIEILNKISPLNARFGDSHIVSLTYIGVGVFKITFIFFIAKGSDYWNTINAVNLEIIKKFEEAQIII